ncbi:hypothetical protein DAMA08_014010 [Martiniozyma asiatica (nom. inval.)]|nr:hypothetical protein DAMA08_014010 [Martiniozyma asiatica]
MSGVVSAIAFPEDTVLAQRKPSNIHPLIKHVSLLSRRTLAFVVIVYLLAKLLIQPRLELTLERRFELQNLVFRKIKAFSKRLKGYTGGNVVVNVKYSTQLLTDRIIATDDIILEQERAKREALEQDKSVVIVMNGSGNGKGVRFENGTKDGHDVVPLQESLNDKVKDSMGNVLNSVERLRNSLKSVKSSVPSFEKWDGSSYHTSHTGGDSCSGEMNVLQFQMKQLKNYLEVVTSEHPKEMLFKKPVSHIEVGQGAFNEGHNYVDILNQDLNGIKGQILSLQG